MKIDKNISHFILLKELPFMPVGTKIDICRAAGRQCLYAKDVEFPLSWAENTDFFKPVTMQEYKDSFVANSIDYLVNELGATPQEAKTIVKELCKPK
jgi:hypothetical protein